MHDKGKGSGLIRCVVASCNERERIIHTRASTSKIAELLQREVLSEPRHLATPLCVNHYRQVHRLLHSDDHMYSDKKCHACYTLIRYCGGIARHCPNPAAVNQMFSMNGDTDISTPLQDYVCTSCYNHHLAINQYAISTSTDEELRKLLASHLELPPWAKTYIGNALYVSTGCDFTSFFYGIGKVTFLKAFYRHSQFISAPAEHTPGSLADISPDSNGFLAFILSC